MSSLSDLRRELKAKANPVRAKQSQYYFKTEPGQYGHGDVFWGISVPAQRKIAKVYYHLPLTDVEKLLHSKIHEERLTASIILVAQFKKGDDDTRKTIYNFYLRSTKYINNWDIVDSSAPYIVSVYLWDNFAQTSSPSAETIKILAKLAKSRSVWDRRIAIMSTAYFIRQGDINETFIIAEMLLCDKHDLIHKAVGWMLREVGNSVGIENEEKFLKKHYKTMPRTMLRYAIEKFPEAKRQAYLNGTV
jgi:3-methyladenine DNA glycosylase AlkD